MTILGRRRALLGSVVAAAWGLTARAQALPGDVRTKAAAYLAGERHDTRRPFRAWSGGPVRDRTVLLDYFPAMPLSLDNNQRSSDLWARSYLSPSGLGGQFADVGGYTQQRPLSPGAWNSPDWERINLAIDVLRAVEVGADGFLVDVLRFAPEMGWHRVTSLYEVAAQVAPSFRIAPCIDHAALPNVTAADIVAALTALSAESAAFRLPDRRMLVTAFAPERRGAALWAGVIEAMQARGSPIAFMPIFLSIAGAAAFVSISYGLSTWGERDPAAVAQARQERQLQAMAGGQSWMQAVAPQDVRPKAHFFWEAQGTGLFAQGWQRAIEERAQFVHVITWNDFSETTGVEPATGTQFVFYDLLAYYTALYKAGAPPAIESDAIYYLHRKQLIDPRQLQGGGPFSLNGRTPVANEVEMVAFLTSPAMLEISIAGRRVQQQGQPGMNTFQVPAQAGQPVFSILRRGDRVLTLTSQWPISPPVQTPAPLYVGGSTAHAFTR